MPRATLFLHLLFLGAGITLCNTQAAAQTLEPTGLSQWDSTNQVLFFGHGCPVHVVRAYADARKRGADIDIFKDFPGLEQTCIDSVTAGPDGTTWMATTLNFGGRNVRDLVLTYDSSGQLLRTWNPAPQYAEAIAYSGDDDALFVLGRRELPDGPYASNYPLLAEYSPDGRLLKMMIQASVLKDQADSFHQNGELGEPKLKVTKNRIYIYAPSNREAVIADRNGTVLVCRSISDIIEKISSEDGYHLVQIHNMDFNDDGDVVLELLRSNDIDYSMDVFRIKLKTAEAVAVHRSFNGGRLWFIGIEKGQYLYIEKGQSLYVQSAEGQEPAPLVAGPTK
jgi:hypothetical protein